MAVRHSLAVTGSARFFGQESKSKWTDQIPTDLEMHERVHQNPNLIFSVGTQVVALTEVRSESGKVLHPRGAVGIVLKAPMDLRHSYWVRFLDGVEAPLKPSEIMLLAQYKKGEIGDSTITASRTNLYDRVRSGSRSVAITLTSMSRTRSVGEI